MPTKTFSGSCLCGNIKYTVDLDVPEDGRLKANRCNCTYCMKPGVTNVKPADPSTFKLLSPKSRSELGDYNPKFQNAHKYFCQTCGCHVWAEGEYSYEGQIVEFFTMNIACFDQPQEALDLSKVKLSYWDGKHDNWKEGMREAPFTEGLP